MPYIRTSNFNAQREIDEQDGSEWKFGALSQPALVSIPLDERDHWLPRGEMQFGVEDFIDCATRSPTNAMEAHFSYGYQKNIFSEENKKWLRDAGFVDAEGWITFSNRYNSILSGTTREGNSLIAPLRSIISNGMIPENLLPQASTMTFDQYQDPKSITQEMRDIGKEFTNRFTISYEQVQNIHFADVALDDLVGCALFAWPPEINGIYPPTDASFNHAVAIFKPKFFILDNYGENGDNTDFIKQLDPNYNFFQWGYRIFIASEKKSVPDISLYQQLVDLLSKLLALLQAPKPPVVPPPPVILPPVTPTLIWDNPVDVRHSIRVIGDRFGFSPHMKDLLCDIAYCESSFKPNARLINSPTSIDRGLYQWNNKYHPDITDTIAYDPEQNTILACKALRAGKATLYWSASKPCWNKGGKYNDLLGVSTVGSAADLQFNSSIVDTTNMPDSTITAAIVIVVGAALSVLHINYAGDLTQVITALVTLVAGAVAWYQRTTLTKAPAGLGDVTAFGQKRS